MNTLLRLLLVDDNVAVRKTMCALLASPVIEIIGEAGDGSVAVQAAHRLMPDIVLMDYHMPVMDGLEAARLILAGPEPPLVILFSGDVDPTLCAAARQVGVRTVLQKGVTCRVIHDALVMARQQYEQAA